MIANCDTPDIAMLRWIAFIRMINLELRHIAGKDNPVADMLSRARYDGETFQVMNGEFEILAFREGLYSGELLLIGRYLSTLQNPLEMVEEEFYRLRRKAYKFMLKDGVLWKKSLKKGHVPCRVLDTDEEKKRVLWDSHDAVEARHRGVRATYERVQRWYWWSCMYVDVKAYVGSCKTC
ncbi:unnamed protein product [Calypogeia fissa]